MFFYYNYKKIVSSTTNTTTTTTTTTTQIPCPICYNGGYCNYFSGVPLCVCPCLFSGSYCQTCKLKYFQLVLD